MTLRKSLGINWLENRRSTCLAKPFTQMTSFWNSLGMLELTWWSVWCKSSSWVCEIWVSGPSEVNLSDKSLPARRALNVISFWAFAKDCEILKFRTYLYYFTNNWTLKMEDAKKSWSTRTIRPPCYSFYLGSTNQKKSLLYATRFDVHANVADLRSKGNILACCKKLMTTGPHDCNNLLFI